MKIVGLCKTFSCVEFMPAVMAGIYDSLDKIVFVHSYTDWLGKAGMNEVQSYTLYCDDPDSKIHNVGADVYKQDDQYDVGIKYILENFPDTDWIFLFDTDEVWDPEQLQYVFTKAEECVDENAVSCAMRTYIKSPLYTIDPPEPLRPCVMFRALHGMYRGCRGNGIRPMMAVNEAFFHHFSYVRACEKDVFDKIETSHAGDKMDHIDLPQWRNEKWNCLPHATDLHTSKGYESNWKRVKVIDKQELPSAVLALPFIQNELRRVNE